MKVSLEYLEKIIPTRDYEYCSHLLDEFALSNVTVHRRNNTTIVVAERDGKTVVGDAKRNPNDDPDIPERGKEIAFVRAFRKLRDEGWREY